METLAVVIVALAGLAVLEPTERQVARAERASAERGREGDRPAVHRELGLLRR